MKTYYLIFQIITKVLILSTLIIIAVVMYRLGEAFDVQDLQDNSIPFTQIDSSQFNSNVFDYIDFDKFNSKSYYRVADTNTVFGINLLQGTLILDVANHKRYILTAPANCMKSLSTTPKFPKH